MKEKKFTFKTAEGSWRLFILFLALVLLFSAVANAIQTQGYQYQVKKIFLDTKGGYLSIEQYEPRNVSSDDNLPCMILFHGGSESLAASSMVAWELAKRGFVVLNTSMYSCGLSEQVAVTEDGTREENYFRGGSQGMYDALTYAKTISFVNKEAIGLWGHSAGNLGCAGSLMLDGNYLTLNDRMLTILNSDFGVEITEEQLTQNADDIAKSALSETDLAVYEYKKAEQEDLLTKYIQGSRVSPSAYGKKVKVAGLEVIRDPQVNAMSGVGVHEDSGYLDAGNTDRYKNIFKTGDEPAEMNGWYAIPDTSIDPEAKSTYLGKIFETNVQNSPELAEAIEKGSARLFFLPNTFHNGNLWDDAAVCETVEFFTQTLGYNRGYFADGTADPLDTRDYASSYWTLGFTTASLVSMILALMALLSILLKTKFFAPCALQPYTPALSVKSKNFYIAAVGAIIAAGFGVYMGSKADLSFTVSNATATKWLPWEPGQIRTMIQLFFTAIVGLAYFLVLRLVTKAKGETVASVKDVHLGYGFKNVVKSFLIGAILFGTAYIMAEVIAGLFSSRFMFADGSFELMHAYGFMRLFKYTIILLPCTLVISTLNNMWSLKDVSDGADTAINVFVTSLGAELVVFIALALTFSTPGHGTVFDVHTILSIIALVPIMNYIYRKAYKLTGSVWVGAIVVAAIVGWRLSSYISHQFIYYGPDPIKAFWGFY